MKEIITTLIIVLSSLLSAQEQYAKARIWASHEQLHELAALGLPVDHGEL